MELEDEVLPERRQTPIDCLRGMFYEVHEQRTYCTALDKECIYRKKEPDKMTGKYRCMNRDKQY